MSFLLQVPLQDGGSFTVNARADETPAGSMLEEVEPGGPAARSRTNWEQLIKNLAPVLQAMASARHEEAELKIEFGLRFGGDPDSGGMILVPPADGTIKVTSTWTPVRQG